MGFQFAGKQDWHLLAGWGRRAQEAAAERALRRVCRGHVRCMLHIDAGRRQCGRMTERPALRAEGAAALHSGLKASGGMLEF